MAQVLVTDDSRFQRNLICKALEKAGHKTLQASNGSEALELLEKHNPGVMSLDLLMPVFDGLETLKELQNRGIKIPVIVCTSDIQESTEKICMDLGAVGFVTKPVKGKSLENFLNIVKCYT